MSTDLSLSNSLVKMRFVRYGYLPNYPYHMISDREMCNAFMHDGSGYFYDEYPLLNEALQTEYDKLIEAMQYHIDKALSDTSDEFVLPDWIYSYMMGTVVSSNSDALDLHDLLVPLGVDNIDDIFTAEAQAACYNASSAWLSKLPPNKLDHRPPTMFGEPHVIKYLRLLETDPAGLVI